MDEPSSAASLCLGSTPGAVDSPTGPFSTSAARGRSPGYSDTWLFLEREVNSLHTAASVGAQLQAFSPANLLMSLLAARR